MPELLTLDEVASALRLSREATKKRYYRGQLPPAVKIGRRYLRWLAEDIRAMLTPTRPAEGGASA